MKLIYEHCIITKIWPLLVLCFLLVLVGVNPHAGLASSLSLMQEWQTGRHGRTIIAAASAPKVLLVLAQDRTERRDPLNNFNIYRGGWDVKSEHYWASAGYTGGPGYALAAAWLLVGLAFLLLLCCCCCCCCDQLKGPHQGGNTLPLILLFLFTGAVVAGCVFVYLGQGKAHNELMQTLDFVVQESEEVVVRLQNTSTALTESQNISVLQFSLSSARKTQIQNLNKQLMSAASILETQTKENADNIIQVLNNVRLAMIVVAGVMLLLVLLGFFFSTLGMTTLMYMLVVIVWLLVAGTWILCGVYIMLNNVVGDTCIAMKEWVTNPSAQTSLQEILPCVDISTTNRALDQTRQITNETVSGINTVIATILNNGSTSQGLPLMCNPLQSALATTTCVDIVNVPETWLPFVCKTTAASQACPLGGKLTPKLYNQLNNSVAVVNELNDNIPFLIDLANCNFVRQAFTEIQQQHCHPLRKYLKWEYIGLALISGGFMFSIWLWIVLNRRRRYRFFQRLDAYHNHPQFISPKNSAF